MTTIEEVQRFLDEFKTKLNVFDVIFRDDRGKNTQTLLDLEIRPIDRISILVSLVPEDYSEGPIIDILYGNRAMWVFGRVVNNIEIYIKISLGVHGSSVICISFHVAEHKMKYPFKK